MQKNDNISSVLKSVSKPGRYIGGEYNSIIKNKDDVKCRFAFAFPDTSRSSNREIVVKVLDFLRKKEMCPRRRTCVILGDF